MLLRPCGAAESRIAHDLSGAASPARCKHRDPILTGNEKVQQACVQRRRLPVPPGRQRKPAKTSMALQAAPARKQLASRSRRLLPQTKRRGIRGQPWCCLGLAATGRPLVLSREWERTAPHIRRCAKEPRDLRMESPLARATGKGPPDQPLSSGKTHRKRTLPGGCKNPLDALYYAWSKIVRIFSWEARDVYAAQRFH